MRDVDVETESKMVKRTHQMEDFPIGEVELVWWLWRWQRRCRLRMYVVCFQEHRGFLEESRQGVDRHDQHFLFRKAESLPKRAEFDFQHRR